MCADLEIYVLRREILAHNGDDVNFRLLFCIGVNKRNAVEEEKRCFLTKMNACEITGQESTNGRDLSKGM